MKNTMRKKWISLITSFIIVVLLFVIYSEYMHFPRYTYKYITGGSREKTKEITKNIELIQELPYSNEVSGVSFIFSTNGHKVIGDISVKAIGKNSGFTYFNQTIDGKNIHNDELIDFFYNSDQNYGDESISVVISSTCDSEKGVMLLVTGDDSLPDHSLIVGDKLLPVDLVTQNIYLRNVDIYPWIIFSLFVIAIVVELAVIIWKKMDFKIFFRQTLISIIVTLLFIVYNSMVVSHRVLPNILENEQIFIRSYLFIFTLIYFSMFFYKIIGKEFIFRYRFVILFIVFILCVSMEITG